MLINPFSCLFNKGKDLACPGPFDMLHREAKNTLPSGFMQEGAKLDATAILTPNMHVSHSLHWGQSEAKPTYTFSAGYQADKTILNGSIDQDWGLQARLHQTWWQDKSVAPEKQPADQQQILPSQLPKPSIKTKLETALPYSATFGASPMFIIEHEHTGPDYSVTVKAINPNPIDVAASYDRTKKGTVTGIYSASYLQSLTKSFTAGAEFLYQHQTPDTEEANWNVVGKWAGFGGVEAPPVIPAGMPSPYPVPNPADPTQLLTASFAPSNGMLHASYWKRVNHRLEVAGDLQSLTTLAGDGKYGRREGIASVGFKLQTVVAMIRGGFDTAGKVMGVVEYPLAPGLAFSVNGDFDYARAAGPDGKVGVSFSLEM